MAHESVEVVGHGRVAVVRLEPVESVNEFIERKLFDAHKALEALVLDLGTSEAAGSGLVIYLFNESIGKNLF